MRKVILISIVLNLFLAGAVAYGWKARNNDVKREAVSTSPQPQYAEPADDVKVEQPAEASEATAEVTESGFSWHQVESADYKAYIANLRQIGCPEETIRDIIIADVGKFYRNKLAPLRKSQTTGFKFWERENHWGRQDPEYWKAFREAEKEKTALLKELLGVDYLEEMAKSRGVNPNSDSFYKTLDEKKKEQMGDIQMKYSELEQEIYRKAKGHIDEEDQEALSKIRKERDAELAKILTPDELFEYQIRHSNTIQQMKWNELEGFDLSETEFRAIAKAKLKEEGLRSLSREERAAKAKETEEMLKTTLGEERFKEYKLNSNYEYRRLNEIATKLNLGKETSAQIYGMKSEVESATRKVNADKTLTHEQRIEKLTAIKDETEKAMIDALTPRGYNAYKRHAYWLRNVVPRQASSN